MKTPKLLLFAAKRLVFEVMRNAERPDLAATETPPKTAEQLAADAKKKAIDLALDNSGTSIHIKETAEQIIKDDEAADEETKTIAQQQLDAAEKEFEKATNYIQLITAIKTALINYKETPIEWQVENFHILTDAKTALESQTDLPEAIASSLQTNLELVNATIQETQNRIEAHKYLQQAKAGTEIAKQLEASPDAKIQDLNQTMHILIDLQRNKIYDFDATSKDHKKDLSQQTNEAIKKLLTAINTVRKKLSNEDKKEFESTWGDALKMTIKANDNFDASRDKDELQQERAAEYFATSIARMKAIEARQALPPADKIVTEDGLRNYKEAIAAFEKATKLTASSKTADLMEATTGFNKARELFLMINEEQDLIEIGELNKENTKYFNVNILPIGNKALTTYVEKISEKASQEAIEMAKEKNYSGAKEKTREVRQLYEKAVHDYELIIENGNNALHLAAAEKAEGDDRNIDKNFKTALTAITGTMERINPDLAVVFRSLLFKIKFVKDNCDYMVDASFPQGKDEVEVRITSTLISRENPEYIGSPEIRPPKTAEQIDKEMSTAIKVTLGEEPKEGYTIRTVQDNKKNILAQILSNLHTTEIEQIVGKNFPVKCVWEGKPETANFSIQKENHDYKLVIKYVDFQQGGQSEEKIALK